MKDYIIKSKTVGISTATLLEFSAKEIGWKILKLPEFNLAEYFKNKDKYLSKFINETTKPKSK